MVLQFLCSGECRYYPESWFIPHIGQGNNLISIDYSSEKRQDKYSQLIKFINQKIIRTSIKFILIQTTTIIKSRIKSLKNITYIRSKFRGTLDKML